MKMVGETWLFFAGYNNEAAEWVVRFHWGGRDKERGINGLFNYRRSIVLSMYKPKYGRPQFYFYTNRNGFYP